MNPLIWTGLGLGIVFGFALQRGRFCMNSAFRDILLMKDFTVFKAVAAAILIEMVGFEILALTGVINLSPKPLLWGANIVGGLLFGVGMVVAGGCASGITYRVGEGMVGAMSAVLGFSLAGLATSLGVLKPAADYLQTNTKVMTADGKSLTLANVLGLPHYVVAFGLAAIIIVIWLFFALRNREEGFDTGKVSLGESIFKRGWGWMAAGIVIGLIGIAAFPLSAATGRSYPLGITGGWVSLEKTLVTGENAISWEVLLVIGVVLGSAIAALIAGEFKLRSPAPVVLIQTFAGGLLMGFGAVTAGGCNIGHILSGVPQLSIGSIVSGLSIITGAWITGYLLFMRPEKAPAPKPLASSSARPAGD
jgi:uncharacterized membrane protein YedE/YeeE